MNGLFLLITDFIIAVTCHISYVLFIYSSFYRGSVPGCIQLESKPSFSFTGEYRWVFEDAIPWILILTIFHPVCTSLSALPSFLKTKCLLVGEMVPFVFHHWLIHSLHDSGRFKSHLIFDAFAIWNVSSRVYEECNVLGKVFVLTQITSWIDLKELMS